MLAREANHQATTSWHDNWMVGWGNTNANTMIATITTQKTEATVLVETVMTTIIMLAVVATIEGQKEFAQASRFM